MEPSQEWLEFQIYFRRIAAQRLIRDYRLEILTREGWIVIADEKSNYLRFREHELVKPIQVREVKLTVFKVWGENEAARVYEIRVY